MNIYCVLYTSCHLVNAEGFRELSLTTQIPFDIYSIDLFMYLWNNIVLFFMNFGSRLLWFTSGLYYCLFTTSPLPYGLDIKNIISVMMRVTCTIHFLLSSDIGNGIIQVLFCSSGVVYARHLLGICLSFCFLMSFDYTAITIKGYNSCQ